MGNVLAAAWCFEKTLIGKQVLKKESCFLDASIRNQLFFYFTWLKAYSYSTVAGGLDEISYTTLEIPRTSFVIRLLARSSTS